MTPIEIGDRLLTLTAALVDKIDEQPWINPMVKVSDDGSCEIRIYREFEVGGDYFLGKVNDPSFDGVLNKADEFIAALPSAKEAARTAFHGKLGKLIDEGREIGIETEFMNPLTATMKALSENILTDQRAAS